MPKACLKLFRHQSLHQGTYKDIDLVFIALYWNSKFLTNIIFFFYNCVVLYLFIINIVFFSFSTYTFCAQKNTSFEYKDDSFVMVRYIFWGAYKYFYFILKISAFRYISLYYFEAVQVFILKSIKQWCKLC